MPLLNDTRKHKIFLDASALFAAVYSRIGGARMLLRLAEGAAVQVIVSSQVLSETEGALRRKAHPAERGRNWRWSCWPPTPLPAGAPSRSKTVMSVTTPRSCCSSIR